MKNTIKYRITLFGLVIAVVLLTLAWAATASWREVGRLQNLLSTRQLRSFEIADHLQDSILKLNGSLVRFELQGDTNSLKEFEKSSEQLNAWIDTQKPVLSSPNELDLLNKIDTAYDVYLATATNVNTRLPLRSETKLSHIENILKASVTMLELGYQLEDAHREALERFLVSSQQSVLVLQRLLFLGLIVLLATFIWLAIMIYRDMIAPLQKKLIESTAIIERQEKLASLGMLTAGVAHEIGNPLTAIKARLFTVHEAFEKNSPEYKDVQMISDEINRLESIIRDFLQFARPNQPALTKLDAREVLTEVAQLYGPQFSAQDISIHVEAAPGLFFSGDLKQIKQVLINLVKNASESIVTHGRIFLRARYGTITNGTTTTTVVLEVEDTGKGIPVDVQKRLFDPFFSTKETGSGLGLAIAARIVQNHGGALEFQTQVNRGTTFGIVLPSNS